MGLGAGPIGPAVASSCLLSFGGNQKCSLGLSQWLRLWCPVKGFRLRLNHRRSRWMRTRFHRRWGLSKAIEELVKGYGRKSTSSRCSLKIDHQKAFDTLHWGFISSVLNAIQLPKTFIDWIEACFSDARYSISFNGSLIGYIKGERGIRQGDLLSPFLFVLAMNVLSKILNLAVARGICWNHYCFNKFYEKSGLKLNAAKCEFYTSGISTNILESINKTTGFKQGCLPVRYLGVPLVTRKLSEKDCVVLINNIKSRLYHWSGKLLSYAGRLELIRAKGSDKAATGAKVSWGTICQSKPEGELGLKDLKTWNMACMIQLIRSILAGEGSLWVAWLNNYVLNDKDFWHIDSGTNTRWSFRKLLKLRREANAVFSTEQHQFVQFGKRLGLRETKLPTKVRLQHMGIVTDGLCVLYLHCLGINYCPGHVTLGQQFTAPIWVIIFFYLSKKNNRGAANAGSITASIHRHKHGLRWGSNIGPHNVCQTLHDLPARSYRATDISPTRLDKYCTLAWTLRKLFDVDAADYMLSLFGSDALRELSSPEKSGSFFYLTSDDKYMIKTMKKAEAKVLVRMLPAYYKHVQSYKDTLVTKLFGLHCVKLTGEVQRKVRFVIIGNLFCSEYAIHRRFDLKGSCCLILFRHLSCRQLDRDCDFLEREIIMDYSLLVGLHFSEVPTPCTSGVPTPTGNENCENGEATQISLASNDQLVINNTCRQSSDRLGIKIAARAEKTEYQLVGEPTGVTYDVILFFGIIDILQDYDISEKLEHAYKSMQYDPTSISAVEPKLYSKRFWDFIFEVCVQDT
ncbi:Phosphatidylinositol 4-phosphate 5-kinase 6 [Hibiscus syriacus]|uniref:1-phosphatidylinositol-4-phosphate 5-kinase n=1 Tax=Hibiscus syriacus TaxID=106335 RepID=A0A6A2X6B3_HIBSY|nr:Phosphatidylinositol 4-phosphate 5-kinase 6 [Hibiscus syriacus]